MLFVAGLLQLAVCYSCSTTSKEVWVGGDRFLANRRRLWVGGEEFLANRRRLWVGGDEFLANRRRLWVGRDEFLANWRRLWVIADGRRLLVITGGRKSRKSLLQVFLQVCSCKIIKFKVQLYF